MLPGGLGTVTNRYIQLCGIAHPIRNSLGTSAVIVTKLALAWCSRARPQDGSYDEIATFLSAIMDNLRRDQLDISFHEEKLPIENVKLKEDSPLDLSDEFSKLCLACRTGDLKSCQELITNGVNINARDQFDYTPLVLVNLVSAIFFN